MNHRTATDMGRLYPKECKGDVRDSGWREQEFEKCKNFHFHPPFPHLSSLKKCWQGEMCSTNFFPLITHLQGRVRHLLADLGWVDLDLESSQAGGPLL